MSTSARATNGGELPESSGPAERSGLNTILCPTRGGEASYRAQDAAIALAKQYGARLIFLYVVDTHFLDKTERAVRPDIVAAEMARMGEFLLTMAQERAKAQEIYAEVRTRHGEVAEEIKATVREEKADVVIWGRPVGEEGAFRLDALESLASEIAKETGTETRIV